MKSKIKQISIIFILVVAALITGCSSEKANELPYYITPELTPEWMSSKEAESKNIHKVADFEFTDQNGQKVNNSGFKGKIYLANFFFTTCPGICPTMTRNLLKVQEHFKNENDVMFISHSVMPSVDSISSLKAYETNFKIDSSKWRLVTGKTSKIYEMARRSYFAEEEAGYNSDSTEFLHTEHVVLVDKKGHIRGIYNGTLPLDMDRIISDINLLKKES